LTSDPTPTKARPAAGRPRVDLTQMDLKASVLFLAVPAVMRNLLQTVIQMVSLMIVGSLGSSAIASVGIANRVFFVIIGVLSALSVGATALVARCIGARDQEAAERVVSQSVLFALVVGFTMAFLGWVFATPIMNWMMQLQEVVDQEVVHAGAVYIRIVCASMSVGVLLFMTTAVMQGAGDMTTTLYLMTGVNVLNLFASWLLVYGIGPLPALGVAGAGYGAAVARATGGLVGFWLLAKRRSGVGFSVKGMWQVHLPTLNGILGIGIPAAGENLLREGAQILYTVLVAGMGTAAVAANSIGMSIQSLSFMPGFGFGLAATALVGQNLGAKQPDRAERAGYESLKWSMYIAAAATAVFLFLPAWLARMYSSDPEVVSLTAACLRITAMVQFPLAVAMVLAGALRGAGDTKWVMYITAAGNWGVRLLGSWYLGVHLGWGLLGVWAAMAGDQLLRGVLTLWRFRTGHWKHLQPTLRGAPRVRAVG
jgi:putative MATE family efflux protein